MKNYSKYGKGWFRESDRHRLARLGIRTGRKTASIGYGLSKINYGKIMSSHEFRIDGNTTIVARSEDTRSGFRHIADLYRDGTLVESAKATYLNRTWEKYEFQSVIKELLNKAKYSETEQDKIMNKIEGKALGKVDEQFKSVAMVASLGEVFGKTEKEKNTWKLRMIKAGLGKSFQEPEDWDTLSEEEKGKRLDKIIKLMKDKNKDYSKKSKLYRKVIPLGYGKFTTRLVTKDEMLKYIKKHNPTEPKSELIKILKRFEVKKINYAYTPADLPGIVTTGLGTAGASAVGWIPTIVAVGATKHIVKQVKSMTKKKKKRTNYTKEDFERALNQEKKKFYIGVGKIKPFRFYKVTYTKKAGRLLANKTVRHMYNEDSLKSLKKKGFVSEYKPLYKKLYKKRVLKL